MSSTFLQFRSESEPMSSSPSKRTHASASYTANQTESKQSHNPHHDEIIPYSEYDPPHTDRNPRQPHSVDNKLHFKSTNRSSHHEVSADNWRISYYMNLNLVKQPQHIMQYRSSSLPHPSPPTYDSPPGAPDGDTCSRKSAHLQVGDVPIFMEQEHAQSSTKHTPKKKNHSKSKRIHIIQTRSQNNTPPRGQLPSLLRKHHKRVSRLSRVRSRSDGQLSFHGVKQKSRSVESVEDDDDNDSVSTTDSVNNHHLNAINAMNAIHIKNDMNNISLGSNLTPPGRISHSKKTRNIKTNHDAKGMMTKAYPSSRTPPANATRTAFNNHRNNNNNTIHHHPRHHRNRFESEPLQYHAQSQNIAVQRSRPLSINKHKVKPRFDVDFQESNSYQGSSPELLFDNTNTEYLVDDEANFEMD